MEPYAPHTYQTGTYTHTQTGTQTIPLTADAGGNNAILMARKSSRHFLGWIVCFQTIFVWIATAQVHSDSYTIHYDTFSQQYQSASAGTKRYFHLYQSRRWQVQCTTDLIRKVMNFIEKNTCRLVYTEHDWCSITWTSYYIPICWPWIHFGLPDWQTKVASDSVYGIISGVAQRGK